MSLIKKGIKISILTWYCLLFMQPLSCSKQSTTTEPFGTVKEPNQITGASLTDMTCSLNSSGDIGCTVFDTDDLSKIKLDELLSKIRIRNNDGEWVDVPSDKIKLGKEFDEHSFTIEEFYEKMRDLAEFITYEEEGKIQVGAFVVKGILLKSLEDREFYISATNGNSLSTICSKEFPCDSVNDIFFPEQIDHTYKVFLINDGIHKGEINMSNIDVNTEGSLTFMGVGTNLETPAIVTIQPNTAGTGNGININGGSTNKAIKFEYLRLQNYDTGILSNSTDILLNNVLIEGARRGITIENTTLNLNNIIGIIGSETAPAQLGIFGTKNSSLNLGQNANVNITNFDTGIQLATFSRILETGPTSHAVGRQVNILDSKENGLLVVDSSRVNLSNSSLLIANCDANCITLDEDSSFFFKVSKITDNEGQPQYNRLQLLVDQPTDPVREGFIRAITALGNTDMTVVFESAFPKDTWPKICRKTPPGVLSSAIEVVSTSDVVFSDISFFGSKTINTTDIFCQSETYARVIGSSELFMGVKQCGVGFLEVDNCF